MELLAHALAILAHAVALVMGLNILHRYKKEFTHQEKPVRDGLNEVELSYMTIVLSTLLAPVSIWHLCNKLVSLQYLSDINVWDGLYWAGLGVLLSLFHILTKHLMGRVSKNGFTTGSGRLFKVG